MRAGTIVIIMIALMASSSIGLGQSIPFSISSFGFPAAMLQPSFYGSPADYFPVESEYSSYIPASNSALVPSGVGSYASYLPEMSSFGFPAMSGMGSISLPGIGSSGIPMVSPLGFPSMQIPEMMQTPALNGTTTGSQGPTPIATNNYTESSNGKTIKVKVGDIIHVQLPARIDQGYTWNLSTTHGLNITSQRMYAPTQVGSNLGAGIIGLLSTQEWDIQAIEPGSQTITGIYQRSWAGGADDRTYKLTVIVE